tara:strand:- start:697 stop:1080 length:384 start_codon:yes stop_codon:yes gene_type:complete
MAKNYTFNANISCSATSASGYTQSESGNFSLNLTGIDQVETGRKNIATGGTVIMTAPTYGKVVYVRNLDDTNFVTISMADDADNTIAVLEPGEFFFTILRDNGVIRGDADTATVTVEYFAVEIDSNA